jgi:hypothetical protein
MWRNDRRNGLKIALLAISMHCAAYQSRTVYLRKTAKFTNFFCLSEREQKGLILAQTLAQQ